MKHTKEEIINALKIIKDECSETDCADCLFGDSMMSLGTLCNVQRNSPNEWEINDIQPQTWRALK